MPLPDCFVLCVCSHLYVSWFMFVCVCILCLCEVECLSTYATVYSSVITFALTKTNLCHSAVSVVEWQSAGVAAKLPPQKLRKRETLMNKRVGGQIKSTGMSPISPRILDHTAQAFLWIKHGRVLGWKWVMLIFKDSIVGSVISLSSWL